MPKYCGINGEVREIVSQYCGVDGEVREIKEEYCGVDGVVRKIFSKNPPIIMGMWDRVTNKVYSYVTDNMVVKNSDGSYTLKTTVNSTGSVYLHGVLILPMATDEYDRFSCEANVSSTTEGIYRGSFSSSSEPVQGNTSWSVTPISGLLGFGTSTTLENKMLLSDKYIFILFDTTYSSGTDTLTISDLTLYTN